MKGLHLNYGTAPYSSFPKSHLGRNFQYGGAHSNGLIEKGDETLSTLVTSRPWLINTADVSPVTRHDKPWNTPVLTIGRQFEPHHNQHGPPVYNGRRNGIAYLTNL